MANRIIYWFRNDLRLSDNEALRLAAARADEIIPVYVFDKRKFAPNRLGFRKTGTGRARFLLKAVANLQEALRRKGGELIIRTGEPEKIVAELANEYTVSAVFASKEITLEETNVESSLSKRLKVINVDFELIWMNTLFHPRDLPFYISRLPDTYDHFREAIRSHWRVRPFIEAPDKIRVPELPEQGPVPPLSDLGFDAGEAADTAGPTIAVPAETELLETLRTESLDPEDCLFWISTGLVSPRWAYHHTLSSADRAILLKELMWRDYLLFTTLRYGTRLFKPSGIRHEINKVWSADSEAFDRWRNGQTASEAVNAAMRKLRDTGFLSREESRIAAQHLVHDLGIDWTWGALWFESRLISYEVANTWGNWNFFAGVGTGDPSITGA